MTASVLTVGKVSVADFGAGTPRKDRPPVAGVAARDLLRVATFCRFPTALWPTGRQGASASGYPVLLGGIDSCWAVPTGLHTIEISVPCVALPFGNATIKRLSERRLPPGSAVLEALVRPLMLGMVGRLDDLASQMVKDPRACAELELILTSSVSMLVRSVAAAQQDECAGFTGRRLQVERFIDANLDDPSLDPDRIAAALYISRRSLYLLLRGDGAGVAGLIRSRRLARAHSVLADRSSRHRSIAEIAASVGFTSASHFSRVFRAEFGESPRDVRSRATLSPRPD